MALDPTSREANVRDSIKKYFVDNIKRIEGIEVIFDKFLSSPRTTVQREVSEWISVNFMEFDLETLADARVDVYCCTRQDPEGWRLVQLRDKVVGYLVDNTKTDGMARIDLYRSYPNQPWILLGAMIVQEVGPESGQLISDDETKFKIVPIRLRWGTK
jgi:hypothetical protein